MSQELFNTQLFCRQRLEVDVLFKSGRRRRDWEKVDEDRRTRLSEEQKGYCQVPERILGWDGASK